MDFDKLEKVNEFNTDTIYSFIVNNKLIFTKLKFSKFYKEYNPSFFIETETYNTEENYTSSFLEKYYNFRDLTKAEYQKIFEQYSDIITFEHSHAERLGLFFLFKIYSGTPAVDIKHEYGFFVKSEDVVKSQEEAAKEEAAKEEVAKEEAAKEEAAKEEAAKEAAKKEKKRHRIKKTGGKKQKSKKLKKRSTKSRKKKNIKKYR